MLSAIWAQSLDGVIGDGTSMPWHIPEDLRHFKEVTYGNPVIMGRKTWQSLPTKFRPLPGRKNYVLSRSDAGEWSEGAEVITVFPAKGWVMGGGEVYRAVMDEVRRLEVTLIEAQLSKAVSTPVFAPQIGPEFEIVAESEWQESEKGSVQGIDGPARFRFLTYQRKES